LSDHVYVFSHEACQYDLDELHVSWIYVAIKGGIPHTADA